MNLTIQQICDICDLMDINYEQPDTCQLETEVCIGEGVLAGESGELEYHSLIAHNAECPEDGAIALTCAGVYERDNKLSDPVAYTNVKELQFRHGYAKGYMWPAPIGFGEEVPLYSQEYVSALLSALNVPALLGALKTYQALANQREQEMRAQNLEIKTLLAEKVKTLETKLWDSQQLVDAKSHSQNELRSQISNLEERNRKEMSSRGKRICELDDLLEAANMRIAELEEEFAFIMGKNDGMEKELRDKDARIEHLESKLATPVRLPAAKDTSRGWTIDPDYLSAIAQKVGYSEDKESPSMETVEAVLLATGFTVGDETANVAPAEGQLVTAMGYQGGRNS
ncbi:hypothetical protein SME36J_45700 [Serratia marcescens]|nr:hypothetical protein SME36J_45700 [Serratia marcescens]